VKGVIDFFTNVMMRADIVIAQASARVVSLEVFDQPAGIINTDVKAIVGRAQKCAASSLNSRPICHQDR